MDFVRREENKLYELIDSLSQEEIARLEEERQWGLEDEVAHNISLITRMI